MAEDRIHGVVDRVVSVFSKYVDELLDIYNANRYLLAVVETLIHEFRVGALSSEELEKIAMMLRDKLIEGPGSVNPFIMEVLGILEEGASKESVEEALELVKKLWREDSFDKLEV